MVKKQNTYWNIRIKYPFLTIASLALVVFLLGIGIAAIFGARDTNITLSDGEQIRFTGLFDKDGNPISGTIYYANGLSAEIDLEAGKVTYSDGTVFLGKLDADYRRSGQGSITWKNGDSYEGEFVSDKLSGNGVYTFQSGDVYEGEFVDGKKHGKGKYTAFDGSYYEGEFENDLRHGKGKLVTSDGGVYEGDFEKGIKSGYGTYAYPNGDSYEGEFSGDLRHGNGKYVWSNGETYTGEFAAGNMNGYGTYTWPEGRPSYTGYFKNGEIVVVND